MYSSTGCPPLSLSVTVTWASLSDNALVATVPMTGAVRGNVMKAAESRVYAYKDVWCRVQYNVQYNVLLTTQEQCMWCRRTVAKWFTFICLDCNHNSRHTNIWTHATLMHYLCMHFLLYTANLLGLSEVVC